MKKKPLRVGFDLDGVILYNPLRIFRPIASFLKPFVFGKEKKTIKSFYFPKSPIEQTIWRILHKTSFVLASGNEHIHTLMKEKKIEPYIITSRYSFLEKDFTYWLRKMNAEKIFKDAIYNKKNKQPHLYKEEMIQKLDLDYFIEDNWGIVEYLNKKVKKTKIIWIYNIFDRSLTYQYKFPSLKKVLEYISQVYE